MNALTDSDPMRLLLFAVTLALLPGCGEAAAPAAVPDAEVPSEPSATATVASPSTPDAPIPGEVLASPAASGDTLTVVFFGDSLTEGYGLANPMAESYPALIGERLEAAGIPARVVNAGNSGETSAGGVRRADWVLSRTTPDIFVLALGGNDMLRGQPPEETERNLRAILERVRETAPEAQLVVAGLEALPNYGEEYGDAYREVFASAAADFDAALVPFILEGVAGVRELNQPDGVHPTAEGQRRIAATVWEVLGPLVQS